MTKASSHNSSSHSSTGTLSDVRVIDLTRVLAGPTATQILGDLGADVIKIEHPTRGDDSRRMGPPYIKDRDDKDTSDSTYWASVNRNKRSLALDITHPDGQDILRSLAAQADIFIENFRPLNLKKYGLDDKTLTKINPRLIYCSITGFGQTGPYATRGGYDFLVQAMGGLMSVTGEPNGTPVKVGVGIADIITGLYSTIACLAALHKRQESGKGQSIDMALFDAQIAALSYVGQSYLSSQQLPERLGNEHPHIVPYQMFAARDGLIILAVGNDAQFERFCQFAHCTELASDSLFATNDGRVRHRAQLTPRIAAIIKKHDVAYWVDGLNEVRVPCGSINDLQKVFEDPQLEARSMVRDMPHSRGGTLPVIASPMHLSEHPVSYRIAPPLLGEHSHAILTDLLQMTQDRYTQLRSDGIITDKDDNSS